MFLTFRVGSYIYTKGGGSSELCGTRVGGGCMARKTER